MPDIFDLIARWWKRMLVIMVVSLLAVGIITFLKPRKYLSVATAMPASVLASDKSRIFNDNIEGLYSALGSPDDLDKMVGTARLDTVYLAVTREFNLFDHYKMKESENVIPKTAIILKENTKVMKSEYGELKVKVWDTDKNLAPQLANAIMDKLQAIHSDIQGAGNKIALEGLIRAKEKMQARADSSTGGNTDLLSRINEYEKLIGEYQLVVDSKPPVLVIVEKAKASIKPDKPKRMQIMIAAAVLSFLFALLVALVMERRKTVAQ